MIIGLMNEPPFNTFTQKVARKISEHALSIKYNQNPKFNIKTITTMNSCEQQPDHLLLQ